MKKSPSEQSVSILDLAPLAAIVESSDDAILSKDLDGTIKTWNRAAERMYGYTAEEIIGRSVAILMPPEKPGEFTEIMQRLARGERIEHHDTVRIHRDGHRIEVSVSISPVAGPDGRLIGAASIAREIGERRRLEVERRKAADRVARLQRVSSALSEALTPDQVAEVVVRQAVEALEAWAGLVGFEEGGSFRILNSTGYDPAVMDHWRDFSLEGPYPVSDAVRTGQPVWIADQDEYRSRYPALAEDVAARTASSAAIPLLARGRTIGALVLSFDTPQVFDDSSRDFMQALAQQCSQALDRSRLYEAERLARRYAEEARRRSTFLAEASVVLSSSLDYETTLSSVAHLVVPHLADWCTIHLVMDGQIKPVTIAHTDPDRVAWAKEIQKRYPTEIRDDQGLGLVLKTGKSMAFNDITDEMLVNTARDEEHLRLLREARPVAALMAPLTARGRTLGVLTFIRSREGSRYSAADQAQAEDLARRCALAVDNARLFHEAQELNRAKDEFQAMLAHELRNPIGAVSNALLLLDEVGNHGPGAVRYRGIASRQLKHVVRLLDDLLDVSRITRGKVRLRVRPVTLSSIVDASVQAVQPTVQKRRHRLEMEMPREAIWVMGDADRLEQVVRNLLDNAVKYTPDGGRIDVCVERDAAEAVIRVRDSGAGIPAELVPRIFDLFTQADRSLDRAEGGLGIGLTLVKRLVELHGGTIHVKSEGHGRGSEFVVRLPVLEHAPADDAPASGQDGFAERGEMTDTEPWRGVDCAGGSARKRVLLVEDNADASETLTEILQSWGYAVWAVPDGPAALGLFSSERPDVVLLDIGLPGMDGFEVGRRLRTLEGGGDATVVALSGYNHPEDRAKSKEAGFDEHLPKPVDPDVLRRILARAPMNRIDF